MREATRRAVNSARHDDHQAAQEVLNEAYATWANMAEEKLESVTGHTLPKRGCRAAGPKLVWRTVIPETMHRGQRSIAADAYRRMRASIRDMQLVQRDATQGDKHRALQAAREVRDELRHYFGYFGCGAAADQNGECRQLGANVTRLADELIQTMGRPPRSPGLTWEQWCQRATALTVTVDDALKKAEQSEQKEAREAWKSWVSEGAGASAKNAHRAAKIPTEWQPTTTYDEEAGILTANPMKLLAGQRKEYARQWAARTEGQRRWYAQECQALPRLPPADIRAASRSATCDTAQTHHGFHPRHFSLLCDPALEALADLYEAAEALGSWPEQLSLVTMPALQKPGGGYRLIGMFTATYRVWACARRPIADGWEAAHDRPYFAAGSNRSAVDAVWRQSLRAEAATAEAGHTAAAVLTARTVFFSRM